VQEFAGKSQRDERAKKEKSLCSGATERGKGGGESNHIVWGVVGIRESRQTDDPEAAVSGGSREVGSVAGESAGIRSQFNPEDFPPKRRAIC